MEPLSWKTVSEHFFLESCGAANVGIAAACNHIDRPWPCVSLRLWPVFMSA